MGTGKRAKELETIFVLAAAAAAGGVYFKAVWLHLLALALLVAGSASERTAAGISRGWLAFAGVIGKMNSRLLLSLIYFAVITPAAFLFRRFNKDHLGLEKRPDSPSYFRERAHLFSKEDLENPW
jgi:hypothetical protein